MKFKREWNIFQTAIMFFTRIPVSKNLSYSEKYLNSSSKFLPMMGWIVGLSSGLVFFAVNYILPLQLAVIAAMVSSILLTGAFHEDGFADVCDGFGGGWSKRRILQIMKDSRIGAYGMIGMFFLLLSKFVALSEINSNFLPMVFIAGHAISRYFAAHFIYTHQYVRDDETSKSKPLGKKLKTKELLLAIITAVIPLFLFPSWYIFLTIPFIYLVYFFFARYLKKWIGGYTGDCLGAMQQLTELAFYLSVLMLDEIVSVVN